MGVLFLASGVYARLRARNTWTSTFCLYALGSGVHWGGSIGIGGGGLETGLFFVYLAFTALADGALLHLALIYPTRSYRNRWSTGVLYGPAAVALLFSVFGPFVAPRSVEIAAGVIVLLANLLSLTAGGVLVARSFSVGPAIRRASRLDIVVYVGVTTAVVGLLGSSGAFPGNADAWNLLLGVFPVAFAFALVFNELEPPSRAC